MSLTLPILKPELKQEEVVRILTDFINKQGLTIVGSDLNKPWGGFYYIDTGDIEKFKALFFTTYHFKNEGLPLSPKIIFVSPQKRISWQYHFRRSELWKVVAGPLGVCISEDDLEPEAKFYGTGEFVQIAPKFRHRMVAGENWAVVAEIWQHIDKKHPSNENDIIRVSDDHGRADGE